MVRQNILGALVGLTEFIFCSKEGTGEITEASTRPFGAKMDTGRPTKALLGY